MKRKFFVGVCAVFMAVYAAAQSVTFDLVCENLAKHPHMTGNFTQVKTIKAVNRSLKSNGTFIFSLEGIMWKTEKPFPSSLAVGMTTVIQTKADGTQTVIDASSNQIFTSISTTLSSMFSGNAEGLSENFNVSFSSSGNLWAAVLTPKDSVVAAVLTSLSVSGTATASFAELDSIVMTEASGDTITYLFTDQKYPKELTADEKACFTAK